MVLSKLVGSGARSILIVRLPKRLSTKEFQVRSHIRRFCDNKGRSGRDSEYAEARNRPSLKERAMAPPGPNAYGIGKGAVAGGALMGLIGLCYYGIGLQHEQNSAYNKSKLWPKYVSDRIRDTYSYLGGSVIITALSSFAVFNTPPLLYIFTRTGFLPVILTTVAMIGSGVLAQALPYEEGLGAKQLAWAGHCTIMGGILAPLCFMGGPIMMRACLYTGGILGGLSAVAVCAPSDRFLYMGGVLAIGLGLLIASSIASMWLPPTTAIGAGISSFSLYGGLLIFSGFLLYDTQRIIYAAENHPVLAAQKYDPVSAAISVYMDIINIFIRMAVILSGEGGKSR